MKPYHKNPRQITQAEYKRLTDTLARLGDLGGIVHNLSTDEIIGGNQRARVFGESTEIQIVEKYGQPDKQGTVAYGFIIWNGNKYSYRQVMWDERTAEEANIVANLGGGDWNWDIIANEWDAKDLMSWGMDDETLRDWKHGVSALDSLIKSEEQEPIDAEPQIDRAAELNEKWQVKTGDLWQIGEHRLLCGDSTKREDVGRVMEGDKADLLLTDPPYGIDVVGNNGNIGGGTRQAPTTKFAKVIGDEKEFDPRFLLDYGLPTFIWGGNYFAHLLPKGGRWFVWDKNRPEGLSLSDCELAWSNIEGIRVQKFKSTWDGYHVEGEKSGRIHPNQKPIKLISDILYELSMESQIVADFFCGSGTTMVACQNLSRKCRAIEISPNYCAVILQRMADAFPDLEITKL